jgi:hypothetical protein
MGPTEQQNIDSKKPTIGVDNQQPPSIDNTKPDSLTGEYKDSTVEKTEETGLISTVSRAFSNLKSYLLSNRKATLESPPISSMTVGEILQNEIQSNDPITYTTMFSQTEKDTIDLFQTIKNQNSKATNIYINSKDSLSENNLLETTTVITNDDATTSLNRDIGLLFSDNEEPVNIVIDFTKIDMCDFAIFNSLFDETPSFQGQKLGKNIHIIALINNDLYTAVGTPGGDFWRRVFQTESYIYPSPNASVGSYQTAQTKYAPEVQEVKQDDNCLVIEFLGKNWRHVVYGNPDVDINSNIFYAPGELATIQPNQRVYFKDAPWYDIEFCLAFQDIIEKQGYTANHEFHKIPENISFHSCKTQQHEINNLKNKFKWYPHCDKSKLSTYGKTRVINDTLFYLCMQDSTITNGKLAKHDTLTQLLGDEAVAIRVTTKLSQRQWLDLLLRLKAIGKEGIIILQDNIESQPEGWKCTENFTAKNKPNDNIQIKLNNSGYIPEISNKSRTDKYIDIQVSSDTTLDQLVYKFKGVCMDTNIFDIEENLFLKALINGWEINLYGLENNPKLMKELETLLCIPPYLIVKGVMMVFPNAKINFYLPNNAKMITMLWKYLKDAAHEVIRDNLNTIKEKINDKFAEKIDKTLSNKMVDRLFKLVEEINKIPKSFKSPEADLILDTRLLDKVWSQALAEQKDDSCNQLTEYHFIKAFNSIVNKRYREDTETYYLTRLLTNSKNPAQLPLQDQIGLQNFINEQQEITKNFIKENLGLLSKFIPYSPLVFESKINKFYTDSNISMLKKLASAAVSLLKFIFVTAPITIIKAAWTLIYNCFVLISQIMPFMETRRYKKLFDTTDAKDNIKDNILNNANVMKFIQVSIISSIADKDKRDKTQKNLGITDADINNILATNLDIQKKHLTNYDNNYYQIEKFFRDICYTVDITTLDQNTQDRIHKSGYQQLCHELSVDLTKKILLFKQNQDKATDQEKIRKELLAEISNSIKIIMPGESKDIIYEREEIAKDLFNSAIHGSAKTIWSFWLQRREARHQSKLATHPIIITKGEPGTGKSQLSRSKNFVYVDMRPNIKESELHVSYELSLTDRKRELKSIQGPVLQWVNMPAEDKPKLILDEATFRPELLNCFLGMYANPPYVVLSGERIFISKEHRVELISNPDYYHGRRAHPQIEALAAQKNLMPFSKNFQDEQIIKTHMVSFLNRVKFSDDITITNDVATDITKCITTLYSQYMRSIPGYIFTPRDITDCCSKIEAYFSDYITGKIKEKPTIAMIHAVTREAMKDSITKGIAIKYSSRIKAIDIWHQARFVGDNKVLTEKQNQFHEFYEGMQLFAQQYKNTQYSRFDFANKSTQKLAEIIWKEFKRIQLEYDTKVIHDGRHAMVIESPAGMGKDSVIDLAVKYWEWKNPTTKLGHDAITAGVKSTDKIVNHIKDKYINGGLISISEINTYDTQSIEGYLNHYLADQPEGIGYSVICTINPVENNNLRHEFSPALQSRFTRNVLPGHSYNDLHSICKAQLINKKHADLIVNYHWKLISYIKSHGKTACPSIADLKTIANKINKLEAKSNVDNRVLKELIQSTYRKYAVLLGWTDTVCENFFNKPLSLSANDDPAIKGYFIEDLTTWINQKTDENLNAITIISGQCTHFNDQTGIFSLSAYDQQKTTEEKQELILKHIHSDNLEVESQLVKQNLIVKSNKIKSTQKKDLYLLSESEEILNKITTNEVKEMRSLLDCADDFLTSDPKQHAITSTPKKYVAKILDHERNLFCPIISIISNDSDHSKSDYFDPTKISINTRKVLINKLKDELQDEKVSNQLQTLISVDQQNNGFLNYFLSLLEQDDITGNTLIINQGFNILANLNCSVAETLTCLAIVPFKSLTGIEDLAEIITRGNIHYEQAIEIIKNTNSTAQIYKLKALIIRNACNTLLEKKVKDDQVINLTKIMEYVIKESDGNYFDVDIINSLIALSKSEDSDLEYSIDKAKELLDYQYNLLTNREITLSGVNDTIPVDALKDIPQAKTVIRNIAEQTITKLIMQDKQEAVEYSWNPGSGINAQRFLEGKAPFEHIKSIDDFSQNIAILGAPTTDSLALTGLLYHRPTNQIINLLEIMFDDNGNHKLQGSGLHLSNKGYKIFTEFLSTKGIRGVSDDTITSIEEIIKPILCIFEHMGFYYDINSDSIPASEQRKEINKNKTEREIGYIFMENQFNKRLEDIAKKELQKTEFSYIPRDAVLSISHRVILEHTKKLKFCMNFNHSSSIGATTVTSEDDLVKLEKKTKDLAETTPLLSQPQYDKFGIGEELKQFEKQQLKKQLISSTVIHRHDIEKEFQKTLALQ